MKCYADHNRRPQQYEIDVGDLVLQKKKKLKFSTRYDPAPFAVVEQYLLHSEMVNTRLKTSHC